MCLLYDLNAIVMHSLVRAMTICSDTTAGWIAHVVDIFIHALLMVSGGNGKP